MNPHDLDRQARFQSDAEQAERLHQASGDWNVDSYRLIARAARRLPAESLPDDFAARVAARVLLSEQQTSLEDWMVTGLMLAMAIGGLVFVRPMLANVLGHLNFALPELPWPLLAGAVAGIALAFALDRGWMRVHRHAG